MLVDPNGQWVEGEGFFTNLFYSDDRALEIKAQRFADKVGGDLTKIDGGYRVGRVLGGDSKTNTLGEMEINSFYADHSSKVKSGNGQSGGIGFLDLAGGLYKTSEIIGNSRLSSGNYTQLNGKTGNFNDRLFEQLSQWGKTNKTFADNLSKAGKWGGRGVIATSVILGGVQVYNGYQMDGGQFGYNSQSAAANATGSIIGGWAGAEAGAWSFGIAGGLIGGPPGAVIGAVTGGVVGGFGGGYFGGSIETGSVNYYYGR